MLKKIILSVVIIFFVLFGFIAWGLYLMEIEDHYGDLQEIYFKSESGDLILNKETKEFGIITKNWKRADAVTQKNDTLDLYNLIFIKERENKYELLRSHSEIILNKLTFEQIMEMKSKKSLKTILKN
ncbi:hypothetical protein [Flavobacterium sp.]|uniref:hypothetical protein n=1 Tax=Flavobacterium sp. TaxID=239 RepID=UPI004047A13F